MPVMHVEGEEPLSLNLKGLESSAQEPSLLRARGIYSYVLPGSAPTVMSNARQPAGPRALYDMVCS
jgi:hypothetical protein